MTKPTHASEYTREQAELVRATCLHVATKLGDLMDDLLVIGGLVPSLIVDQSALPEGVEPRVGTMDRNEDGNPTRQRWVIAGPGRVTIDFLIPPPRSEDRGGRLRDIEADFAAIIAPRLHRSGEHRTSTRG